jgi:hypothetical protein
MMKKCLSLLFIFSIVFTVTAQENKLYKEMKDKKISNAALYVFKYTCPDLEANEHIKSLEKKHKMNLSSVRDCGILYARNKEFGLTKEEMLALRERMETLAEYFYSSKKYLLFKDTSGMAPVTGVLLDTIAKKQVLTVLSGGGCVITEEDKLFNEIYDIFNAKMNALLGRK